MIRSSHTPYRIYLRGTVSSSCLGFELLIGGSETWSFTDYLTGGSIGELDTVGFRVYKGGYIGGLFNVGFRI